MATVRTEEFKRRVILPLTRVSISAGQNGVHEQPFEIEKIKPQHTIELTISVFQPSSGTNLDIGFSIMNDENYHKWLMNQPSLAFLIANRFKFGTMTFTPSEIGQYHVVFDNRYSVFTAKQVDFSISETWVREKKIKVEAPKPKEKLEKPKPKLGLWQWILNKFRSSRTLGILGLLVAVQLFCVFLAIGIAFVLHSTLGIDYKDTMGYIATAVGGSAVVVMVYIYFVLTGRSLTLISPSVE